MGDQLSAGVLNVKFGQELRKLKANREMGSSGLRDLMHICNCNAHVRTIMMINMGTMKVQMAAAPVVAFSQQLQSIESGI